MMVLVTGQNNSLLFLRDTISGRQFLVDTDSCTAQPGPSLLAANGSSIKTYGSRTLSLHFASKKYQWTFTIADVSSPSLGADFLSLNSLLVDLKGNRLVDAVTFFSIPLGPSNAQAAHLSAIANSSLQTSRHLTLLEYQSSMVWNISLSLKDHLSIHTPTGYLLTSWQQPKPSLTTWKPWVSFDGHPVHGHLPYIWYRRQLEVGVLVVITGVLMMSQYLICTQCPIFRTFQTT